MEFFNYGNHLSLYDSLINSVRISIASYVTVSIIIFIYRVMKLKFKIVQIVKITILLIFVVKSSLYLDSKYVVRLPINNINQFELCYDNCLNIELSNVEKSTLEDELHKYSFSYNEHIFLDNSNYKYLRINDTIIYHKFSEISPFLRKQLNIKDAYYLVIKRDNKYFSIRTEKGNNLTKVINRYYNEHDDILVN